MRVRIEQRFHEPAVEPAGNRSRLELAPLLDHHLERVGELELTLGANIVIHQVLEGSLQRLHVLDVVNAHDGLVAHELLRLFHKAVNKAFLAHHGNAKALRVLDLVGVEDVFLRIVQDIQVRLKKRIAQDNQERLVVVHVRESKAYRLAQPLRVGLHHGTHGAPFGLRLEVLVHLFGLVAGNENRLGRLEARSILDNPVDNCLTSQRQQALRAILGVRTESQTISGDRQYNFHSEFPSIPFFAFGQKTYTKVKDNKKILICLSPFFSKKSKKTAQSKKRANFHL